MFYDAAERSGNDFINLNYLRNYLKGKDLVLEGSVVVEESEEHNCDETVDDQPEKPKFIKDLHSDNI